ncbi:DNA-3-methyladenine glycosylase [Actinacidiphila oryziradicis]|uniref:DNA-3-methyladenine glycosylase n=1 Tax=Actinacidiphila oryziradicis TaxID=2571141 RepID=UPI0038991ECF
MAQFDLLREVPTLGLLAPRGWAEPGVDNRSHCLSLLLVVALPMMQRRTCSVRNVRMWFCLNLVCGPEGDPSGVLLRGGDITVGADLACKRRPASRRLHDLAQGPARLATALGVDRGQNGADVCPADPATSPFTILTGTPPAPEAIRSGPRTGVGGGAADAWRFWIDGDPTVSPYRAHAPRRRR